MKPLPTLRRTLPAALAAATFIVVSAQVGGAQYPTKPPPPATVKPAKFPPFQEVTLPNGIRMVLVESRRQPVVSVSLSFPAGSAYDPAGKEGAAGLVAGLLTKGAGQRSAEEIAATIEGVGGSIDASAGADFMSLGADVLSQHAALAFELLADAAIRPSFPEKEVELLRTQTLSGLQLEMSQPGALASRFFASSLYGEHPYGRRPTPASVRAITRDDLIAFRSARLRPQGALLVVAGDLTMADARKLATQHFGSWTGAAAPTAAVKPPPARTKTEILLVHRPGSVQSNIVVGNTTFTPNDPRFYAATVANRVLGGGADARLFMILREQKSWTYGAYSSIRRPKGIGSFEANAEVRTEVTDSALVEMLAQVRRIGTEAVPAPELEAAKSSLVGSFPLTIETAEQVAGAVAQSKLLGLSPDYLQTYRTRLAAVTPVQLRAAARETMRANALLAVVVGDATKIYDKLETIAPVKVVSAEGTPLAASDLEVKAGAVAIDVSRLVPRSDSFTVMVQGNPFGWSRTALEKTASGFRVTEETQLGPIMQQSTEVLLSPRGEVLQAKQTGKVQGQELKLEASYAGGRVKASGTMPSPQGAKPVAVDTTVPPGTVDNNAIQALMLAFRWAPDAKWTFNVFAPGEGQLRAMTLSVTGTESVTVPAGTFEVYRAELTGGRAPVTFLVTKAAPHRLVKVAQAGAPVEMVLVK